MGDFDPPYQLIFDALQRGRVIPFLGAGASIVGRTSGGPGWDPRSSTYLPTGSELAAHLASQSSFPAGEQVDLAKVAQYYEVVAAGRRRLNDELSGLLSRDFAPGPLHRYLASIKAPMLVVTTNYDDLIERAFTGVKPFDLVIHPTDAKNKDRVLWRAHGSDEFDRVAPNVLEIDLEKTTVIYKMHGSLPIAARTDGHFVITEDDYVEFISRMGRSRAVPAIFAEHFVHAPFLFLGYGLRDWNFRVVLAKLGDQLANAPGLRSWAIQRSVSALEHRLWQHRSVEVFELEIDSLIAEMKRREAAHV